MQHARLLETSGADWRRLGACADLDPELFFPENDEPADEALAACGGCSVRVQCLTAALINREAHGVWGGTTEQDRRRPLGQAAPTAHPAREDGAAA